MVWHHSCCIKKCITSFTTTTTTSHQEPLAYWSGQSWLKIDIRDLTQSFGTTAQNRGTPGVQVENHPGVQVWHHSLCSKRSLISLISGKHRTAGSAVGTVHMLLTLLQPEGWNLGYISTSPQACFDTSLNALTYCAPSCPIRKQPWAWHTRWAANEGGQSKPFRLNFWHPLILNKAQGSTINAELLISKFHNKIFLRE